MDQLRRRFLRHSATAIGSAAVAGDLWTPPALGFDGPPNTQVATGLDVRAFGAVGDGKTDDTQALQKALDQAGASGGDVVQMGVGNFLLAGAVTVPRNVTIQGVFRAPQARTQRHGTCLSIVGNKNQPDGPPAISLKENATLSGLTIFYPEQTCPKPPVEYPWTIRQLGDNASIVDLLIVNPWQAVDCGSVTGGRHYVRGLYGQPLKTGLFIDRCFDVGRVTDVHFWPFWRIDKQLQAFTNDQATAFLIGRTDWEYMTGCFCISYKTGFHFTPTSAGEPNVLLTQCGSDESPQSVLVDACQTPAGLAFTNGQFMGGVQVNETNRGPIKFTSCGFWGSQWTASHAVVEGSGYVTFTACHFANWARADATAAAIDVRSGGVTVNGCEFLDPGKTDIRIAAGVAGGLVFGNRFGGKGLENKAGDRVKSDFNITQ